MSFFDIFKGRKHAESPKINLELPALTEGGYVDYNLETYRVEKKSCYEEGADRSYEWHLVGEETNAHRFLGFEKDDGRDYWFITEEIAKGKLSSELWEQFAKDQAPEHLCVDGVNFYAEHSGAAYFYANETDIDREELIYWDYEDRSGDEILTVEQWGENDFTIYKGRYVNETDFYNIIQG